MGTQACKPIVAELFKLQEDPKHAAMPFVQQRRTTGDGRSVKGVQGSKLASMLVRFVEHGRRDTGKFYVSVGSDLLAQPLRRTSLDMLRSD